MDNFVTIDFNEDTITMLSSITGNELVISKENPKLFDHLLKYMNNIPLMDTKDIIGELNTGLPKNDKVYIRNKCGGTYYAIKDTIDNVSFLYLRAQPDDKFEESDVPVLEVNRDYYEFYSLTLGKELATLACILDMPPEIACLLEEV